VDAGGNSSSKGQRGPEQGRRPLDIGGERAGDWLADSLSRLQDRSYLTNWKTLSM
jgi:hypothetical protein